MSRTTLVLVAAVLISFLLAPAAHAQSVPFTLRYDQGDTTTVVSNNSSVFLPADAVGQAAVATLTITYRGTASASITEVEVLDAFEFPSADFSVSGLPSLPLSLTENQSFTVTLRYQAATRNRVIGRVLFHYKQALVTSQIALNLVGVAPEFSYSYIPQGGNPAVLAPGGTIAFPTTAVDGVSTTTVVITNKGSGAGKVDAISSSGAAFELSGLPLPPATITAARELRFTVSYKPTALETSSGQLTLDLAGGRVTFAFRGVSEGPAFVYEKIESSAVVPVIPGQVVSLPDTLVGEEISVPFRVRNDGNHDGQIASISVLGDGYQVTDLPFLPLVLKPGTSATFTVKFAPSQPGTISGRLRVGDDSFDLAASGLGAALEYSLVVGSTTTTVPSGGSITLPQVAVGESVRARFVVTNKGTAEASINSITLPAVTPAVFLLEELPSLPAKVAPQATTGFTVVFRPSVVGNASSALKVDNVTFTISGAGSSPAPLPGYTFEGASGVQEPLQQPGVGLTLSEPYSLALAGTLRLAFTSEAFSSDPSVQFSSGGRTVNFTIPANSTRAVFPNGTNEIRLQTGTVAGTITLTPSFATEGGIDMTPDVPAALNLMVPQSAPRVLGVQITSKTAAGFTVMVTGFATGRSLTQMDFQFNPVSGENVSTTKVSLNVEASFLSWYQSAASQQYGSQFSVSIPFSMQGDVTNVNSLIDTVQSVAVTIGNRQGTSSAVTANLR